VRIRTQFIISMLVFGVIVVIVAVSAITSNRLVEKAKEQERIAASIARGGSELGYLANDYLIYREGQQLERWQSRFASFSSQVAALNVDKPEQQVLVRNMQANQQRLKEVFESTVSAVGSSTPIRKGALDPAFLQVSWSRMAIQSQSLVSDASRLSQLLHQEMDRLVQIRTRLMYVMLGLLGLFLLASYRLTYRRILKSITALQAGTSVIGLGNLDFKIEEKKNDEIGDLSRAFNRMTADLKTVTASKADLEKEIADRKRAEGELRQQREWLHVTLSSIGDAVIATDTHGRVTFLNPAAVAVTGWRSEDALGHPIQSVFRIINEKTQEHAEDLVARVLVEKRVIGLANDTALVTKDGREVPIEDSAAPILDSSGEITGVVLVFHDVTDKRQAQEALRQNEAKYRTLFENMVEEVHFWQLVRDEAGRIKTWKLVDVNPPTLKTWGRGTVEEIRGKTTDEIFGPGATEHYMPVVQEIMTEGVPHSFEDYFPNLDKYFRFTSVPLGDYFITTGADVTSIKKAEQALRRSEEQARRQLTEIETIYDSAHIGLCVFDRQLRYVRINKLLAEINGLPVEQHIGKTPREVVPDLADTTEQLAERIFRTGEPVLDIEFSGTTPSQPRIQRYWIEQWLPLRNQEGKVIGINVVVEEITTRKQAEEALKKAHDELEKQVQERTAELAELVERLRAENIARKQLEETLRQSEYQVRFFASQCLTAQETERKRVAGELHDSIMASLAAMKFRIDKIAEEMKQGNGSPESLQELGSNVTEINGEVRRIMADLRPSVLDDLGIIAALNWFCREYERTYFRIHVEKKIGISEDEVPDALKTPIFRICQEAMNNIAKYSNASVVNLCLGREDENIRLTIQDNGQGFDPNTAKRGMGLSTMRERAQLSGGDFDLQSAVGRGTLILVSWPS